MIYGNSARIHAHVRNIERYRRLLATQLTDIERQYVKRRISEERAAIRALKRRSSSPMFGSEGAEIRP